VRVTVEQAVGEVAAVRVTEETRRRSAFDELKAERKVNIEAPLAVGDPLDGHLVQAGQRWRAIGALPWLRCWPS
jgi:riboflavin synthase alpha subunit